MKRFWLPVNFRVEAETPEEANRIVQEWLTRKLSQDCVGNPLKAVEITELAKEADK